MKFADMESIYRGKHPLNKEDFSLSRERFLQRICDMYNVGASVYGLGIAVYIYEKLARAERQLLLAIQKTEFVKMRKQDGGFKPNKSDVVIVGKVITKIEALGIAQRAIIDRCYKAKKKGGGIEQQTKSRVSG